MIVEGSKSSNTTDPQCPQIKLSPPVPDILRTVRRVERFNVVTGPTGIMGIVAIFPHLLKLSGGLPFAGE
jgi:hypothetical protein